MKNKHTKTKVTYKRGGITYEHVFSDVLNREQVEQQMIMNLHVGRSDIGGVSWF